MPSGASGGGGGGGGGGAFGLADSAAVHSVFLKGCDRARAADASDRAARASMAAEGLRAAVGLIATRVCRLARRTGPDGLDLEQPWYELLDQLETAQHTRLPLYRGTIDNLVGMVHLRNVLNLVLYIFIFLKTF